MDVIKKQTKPLIAAIVSRIACTFTSKGYSTRISSPSLKLKDWKRSLSFSPTDWNVRFCEYAGMLNLSCVVRLSLAIFGVLQHGV